MVVLSNMVTTCHMWLFTFKLIKMKKRVKMQFLRCTGHTSSAEQRKWLALNGISQHRHRTFLLLWKVLLDRADVDNQQPCLHPSNLVSKQILSEIFLNIKLITSFVWFKFSYGFLLLSGETPNILGLAH